MPSSKKTTEKSKPTPKTPDAMLEDYMDMMDRELAKTKVGKSFERYPKQVICTDQPECTPVSLCFISSQSDILITICNIHKCYLTFVIRKLTNFISVSICAKRTNTFVIILDPFSYSSFQPVLHDWCYPVCGMVHIKEPLLLIGKSSPCGGSGFPLSLSEWSFTICPTPYNRK